MSKRWIVAPPWPQRDEAARRWGVSPLMAQLLNARGLELDADPAPFLNPQLNALHPPAALPGTVQAASLIVEAVRARRKILLYGDYDVDGIMGIAILWHTLRQAGADPVYYVPHRVEEGYGLNLASIRAALAEGAEMVISIDCGISAHDVAAELRERGIPLIITDHHAPPADLPPAAAIVHPAVGGSYPNAHLCGAAVAFKLAWAVAQRLSGGERVNPEFRQLLTIMLPLAALGTVADVVPLVGENRVIARCGLADLPATPMVGLRALIDGAGLSGARIDGADVGFKLAPRLNAAGRMGHARLAVDMFTRNDAEQARSAALYLEKQNRDRQTEERKIFGQACQMIDAAGMVAEAHRAVVVASDEWHAGVIGIVAARIVERYHRPAVVISTRNGEGQGSGRSVRHFDLNAALRDCAGLLVSYGGHPMAAGLRIEAANIEPFRRAFVEIAGRRLTPLDIAPSLHLDAEVAIADLTVDVVERVKSLGPFGAGNPRPRFATEELALADEPRRVGRDGTHLQAVFAANGRTIKAIGFGLAARADELKTHRRCRVAFEPIINDFNGRRTVELQVLDFQFAG